MIEAIYVLGIFAAILVNIAALTLVAMFRRGAAPAALLLAFLAIAGIAVMPREYSERLATIKRAYARFLATRVRPVEPVQIAPAQATRVTPVD